MQTQFKYNSVSSNNEPNIISISDYLPIKTAKTTTSPKPIKSTKPHIPVQPLVGEDIQRVKDYLLNRPERYKSIQFNLRNYTMFTFNINIGLRFQDLSTLQISDIMDNGEIVDTFIITEKKTGKLRELAIRDELKTILYNYIDSLPNWDYDWYLFHDLWPERTPYKPMELRNINYLYDKIEKDLNIKIPLGSHSSRKTFARAVFDREEAKGTGLGIQAVQEALGHSSEAISRRYIGLTREHTLNLYTDGPMI